MFVSWYLHTSSSSFWWPFGSFHTYCILLVLLVLCTILLHTVSLFGDYVSWPHFTLHTYIFLQRPLDIVWPCLWPLSTITNISTHTYLYYKYIRDDPNCVKACHLLHLRWKKKNIAAASKQSMIKEKNFKKLWFWLLR